MKKIARSSSSGASHMARVRCRRTCSSIPAAAPSGAVSRELGGSGQPELPRRPV